MPVPAADGQLCRTCSNKLSRWLSTILEDTLTLNTRIPDNYGWDHGHQHSKVSGSPALSRLDVLALTDPRTTVNVEDEAGRGKRPDPATYAENDSGILQIPEVIRQRAQDLKDEYGLAMPNTNMREAVELLTAQWENLVNTAWIDEFYTDMADIRQLLNHAHNYRPAAAIGTCFVCDQEIRKQDGNGRDDATCRSCKRVYEGAELFKLQLQNNHDTLDQLIKDTIITPKHAQQFIQLKYPQHPTPRESTIRSWLTRGNITTAPNGGIDLDSLKTWFLKTRNQVQAHRRRRRTG